MKKQSNAKLKKKLWKIFTLYIKNRDKWTCITCGRKVESYSAQGGHYMAAGACGLDYYFSEKNVHCQCTSCNLQLEGNRPAYRKFILAHYGKSTLNDLETNYHRPNPSYPFEEKIIEYQTKLKQLQ